MPVRLKKVIHGKRVQSMLLNLNTNKSDEIKFLIDNKTANNKSMVLDSNFRNKLDSIEKSRFN